MLEMLSDRMALMLFSYPREPVQELSLNGIHPGTIIRLRTSTGNDYLVEVLPVTDGFRRVRVYRRAKRQHSVGVGYLGEFPTTDREVRVGESFCCSAKCTSPVTEIAMIGIIAHTAFTP